jgi:hypothetical protein
MTNGKLVGYVNRFVIFHFSFVIFHCLGQRPVKDLLPQKKGTRFVALCPWVDELTVTPA